MNLPNRFSFHGAHSETSTRLLSFLNLALVNELPPQTDGRHVTCIVIVEAKVERKWSEGLGVDPVPLVACRPALKSELQI